LDIVKNTFFDGELEEEIGTKLHVGYFTYVLPLVYAS